METESPRPFLLEMLVTPRFPASAVSFLSRLVLGRTTCEIQPV